MSAPSRIRTASVSQVNVDTTASAVLTSAIAERVGVMVRNNHSSSTLYLGFTEAEATVLAGWPIKAGETWTGDLAPGISLYGISSSGTIDVRIMQGGA
jgi:hypothetical protein